VTTLLTVGWCEVKGLVDISGSTAPVPTSVFCVSETCIVIELFF
jgi:hypothetical protein